MKDLTNNITLKRAIGPAAYDSTMDSTTGAAIDSRGFGSVTYTLQVGTIADTAATFAVRIEEGDDTTAFSTVAADDLVGTTTLAAWDQSDDTECRKLGYRGIKRYTRLVVTPSNNASSLTLSATAILGHPETSPTENPPA